MDKSTKADRIINTSTGLATAAAVIPLPIVDNVTISGIQVSMIISLGAVYDEPINKKTAKGALGVYWASRVGLWLASLLKTFPGLGTFAGQALQMPIAGGMTYALGLAMKDLLEKDIPINPGNMETAAGGISKEQIKRKKKELKEKIKRTKDAEGEINFHADPKKSKSEITFHFNINDYQNVTFRVTEIEDGNELLKRSLDNTIENTVWDVNETANGTYMAFLDCEGLIPIGIKVEVG